MKFRESGMPEDNVWSTFFEPDQVLKSMEINENVNVLVDIGCGYGTFLFPASKIVKKAIGIDIDSQMIEFCRKQLNDSFKNVELIQGDISQSKTQEALKPFLNQIDYVTLFNLLHCEEPVSLLKAVYHILKAGGRVGVIHWKYEKTPRGPSMEIRPKPGQIIAWAESAGFEAEKEIDLPPYHFGIILKK